MRAALISYEYAGTSGGGGIGTYVRNTAAMLAEGGHEVHVFTPAPSGTGGARLVVHPVAAAREAFREAVVDPFLSVHGSTPFDVIESPEFGADGDFVMARLPQVARVVKLHTAAYQLGVMHLAYITPLAKARFVAGALRRGQWPRPFWQGAVPDDAERRIALAADQVISPSSALLEWTARDWPLDPARASVVPNPFVPGPELLSADPARPGQTVCFVGKLEVRKGVLELARAMREVVAAVPGAQLRVVGRALPHPVDGCPLDEHMLRIAGPAATRIEFTGGVPYDHIAGHLANSAVAVFPSYWEAFGYTCLEAMAAGCGVVGSTAGGMAEIIEPGQIGRAHV